MITFNDYERAENKTKWVQDAIISYRNGADYKKAKEEEEYMAGRNVNILNVMRTIYNMAGLPETDFTKNNAKIRNRLIHRLVKQRCSYSLGNGMSFNEKIETVDKKGKKITVDRLKQVLGPKFDRQIYRTAYWALSNGASFLYVHKGHEKEVWQYDLFRKTGFLPLYDERSGDLRGGIRFWSLDWGRRPIQATLYLQEGYYEYETPQGKKGVRSLEQVGEIHKYIEVVHESAAFGTEIAGTEEVSRLPIFPMYSGENKDSALDNMKPKIDEMDMILSGFANDVHDIPQIYWLISGGGGMSEGDKRQLLDRLILQHMAVVDGENAKIQGFTQEIPYEARERCLKQLRNQVYEDWGGFDVHTVEAGATNDHIEAGYQPMDEEADDFEYEIITLVQAILEFIGEKDENGNVDTPSFKRNRVSNQKEQTEMVMLAADHLDDRTILEKLPWVTVDEVDDIMARKDGEDFGRFEDKKDEEDEEDEDGEV